MYTPVRRRHWLPELTLNLGQGMQHIYPLSYYIPDLKACSGRLTPSDEVTIFPL